MQGGRARELTHVSFLACKSREMCVRWFKFFSEWCVAEITWWCDSFGEGVAVSVAHRFVPLLECYISAMGVKVRGGDARQRCNRVVTSICIFFVWCPNPLQWCVVITIFSTFPALLKASWMFSSLSDFRTLLVSSPWQDQFLSFIHVSSAANRGGREVEEKARRSVTSHGGGRGKGRRRESQETCMS